MVTVRSRRGPLRDRLVYFADLSESGAVVEGVAANEVVRFRHALADLSALGLGVSVSETRTLRVDLTRGPDALLAAMSKDCRRQVRRAERIGDRIAIAADAQAATDFLRLYNDFVVRKGYTHPMSRRRYRDYRAVSDVLVAYLDGEPFVGHLNLRDEQTRRVRGAFEASARAGDKERRRLAGWVNRYLHWHEFLTYRSSGFDEYDLGGIEDGTSSIDRFKLSFGGEVEVGQACMVAGPLARIPARAFDRFRHMKRTLARVRG